MAVVKSKQNEWRTELKKNVSVIHIGTFEINMIRHSRNTFRQFGKLVIGWEYKKTEPDCRGGVRAQLKRMKELCKERSSLYEKQNDLKEQKQKIEKSLER